MLIVRFHIIWDREITGKYFLLMKQVNISSHLSANRLTKFCAYKYHRRVIWQIGHVEKYTFFVCNHGQYNRISQARNYREISKSLAGRNLHEIFNAIQKFIGYLAFNNFIFSHRKKRLVVFNERLVSVCRFD